MEGNRGTLEEFRSLRKMLPPFSSLSSSGRVEPSASVIIDMELCRPELRSSAVPSWTWISPMIDTGLASPFSRFTASKVWP